MKQELLSDLPPEEPKPPAVGYDLRIEFQREKLQKQADILKALDSEHGPGCWRWVKGRLKKTFYAGSVLSDWLREHGL